VKGGREARLGSTSGLHTQSGLNCTGHAPFSHGSGYRRVYGEATKHAFEASVMTTDPLYGQMGRRGYCCLNWPGFSFWAGGRARSRPTAGQPSYPAVPRSHGVERATCGLEG
jgi:hypothetical protein